MLGRQTESLTLFGGGRQEGREPGFWSQGLHLTGPSPGSAPGVVWVRAGRPRSLSFSFLICGRGVLSSVAAKGGCEGRARPWVTTVLGGGTGPEPPQAPASPP